MPMTSLGEAISLHIHIVLEKGLSSHIQLALEVCTRRFLSLHIQFNSLVGWFKLAIVLGGRFKI